MYIWRLLLRLGECLDVARFLCSLFLDVILLADPWGACGAVRLSLFSLIVFWLLSGVLFSVCLYLRRLMSIVRRFCPIVGLPGLGRLACKHPFSFILYRLVLSILCGPLFFLLVGFCVFPWTHTFPCSLSLSFSLAEVLGSRMAWLGPVL